MTGAIIQNIHSLFEVFVRLIIVRMVYGPPDTPNSQVQLLSEYQRSIERNTPVKLTDPNDGSSSSVDEGPREMRGSKTRRTT